MSDLATSPIGLDFGTSTTWAAVGDDLIWLEPTTPWLLSLVGYDDDGAVVVGEAASRFARPGHVIRSVKRAITERRGYVRVDAPQGLRDLPADDLILAVLRTAARRIQGQGDDIFQRDGVLLGCPAIWDAPQRRRLLDVAHRSGLPVTLSSLVDEPVAAGIAWLASRLDQDPRPIRVLVFDMGGGTLDLAVLDMHRSGYNDILVLATVGVREGGDTLDDTIADDLDNILIAAGVDEDAVPRSHLTRELLLDAATRLKVNLTTEQEDVVVLAPDLFGPNEIWYTREQLNEALAPQLNKAEEYIVRALRAARLTELAPGTTDELARMPVDTLTAGVDFVALSGGMSQIPYVAQRLRGLFPSTTLIEFASASPESAVVRGLAAAGRYRWRDRNRPAFDVMLEWDGGRESRVIYAAYTPLAEPWRIARGRGGLRFVAQARELALPARAVPGWLRLASQTGEPIRASLGSRNLDGFPVSVSERTFEFSMYPNGHVRLIDDAGVHDGSVDSW